ncbi:YoaK family protein [Rhodococcoides yunnanense]|uniref:YoaK family protein n=1 Tax=Rhodococcoides yunnanense TaxID=278209 RepID=UPI0022B16A40|nr:YoaK family protein [Rhodococcus yunnanensis]MCZ4276352.1 YoaK family protein [Rhodococcus yunnanensis]
MGDADRPSVVTSESVRLGVLLAVVGGFLDAYTFMTRDGVFANAQTANVVLFGIDLVQGDWRSALGYVPPLVAFTLGVFTAEAVSRPAVARIVRRPVRAVLVIEIMVLAIVGFVPTSVPNPVVTIAISFVAALQVTTFRVLVDQAFSTTMTTGNLRSLSQAAFHRIADGDRAAGVRALNFGFVIAGFLCGAILGSQMVRVLDTGAAWVAAGMLVVALALFMFDEWRGVPRVRHPSP